MADVTLLLVGSPNAGKSTLFNALTGGHARVGNWHGVTVGALTGKAKFDKDIEICDLPGIYSTENLSMEEGFTRDYIVAHPEASLVLVSECATLSRSLAIFSSLAKGRRAVLVLTKKKIFAREGGKLNEAKLAERLGIPVLDGDLNTKSLRRVVEAALPSAKMMKENPEIDDLWSPPTTELTRADRLFTHGFFGILVFLALLAAVFYLTFAKGGLGDLLKGVIEWFFSGYLGGKAAKIASPVVRNIVCGGLLGGLGGVLCFLPQIALLYLFLIALEESGLFSRLAFLTDGFFRKVGLSGRAVFSLLLGFGCTAAAILTTRSLENKSVQRRVVACLPYITCTAKLPVFLTLSASFFKNPFLAVVLLYALGVGLSVFVALFLRDEPSPFVLEMPPLQIPRPSRVVKSLLFQIKEFIIKVSTVVLAFFLLSSLLSSFDFSFTPCGVEESMLARICSRLSFLFAPAGMNDWKMAYAAISGLIAKENIAGALSMFYGEFPFSPQSAFAFSVFVLTCSPCVSAIAASGRELGWKRAVLMALFQTVSALLLCYATYFALTGGWTALVLIAIPILLLPLIKGRKKVEKIRRKRARHAQKLHG